MEFQYTTIDIPEGRSFWVQKECIEEFSIIHIHKNYELNLMISGSGKRIVGNNISPFENYDLILIGPGLPHSRELKEPEKNNSSQCLVLYISESLINHDLIQIQELESIQKLFYRAMSGLCFKGEGVKEIEKQILQLSQENGIDSFIALVTLLKNISQIQHQQILSLTPEFMVSHYKDLDQIKIVYDFVLSHVNESFTLDKVAGLLNMAPGSFCRFFKKRSGKSFMQYVKDIRISLACKMLSTTEKPISQICFECGYNNLANFNFYFKRIMKMTPSQYRRNFR
jgi:AraC-like DNA-binding protein